MKRRKVRKLLNELRESIRLGVPHDLTFKPTAEMTKKQVDALQASLDHSFDIWRRTWLFPWLDMLEEATGVTKLKGYVPRTEKG